MESFDEIGRRIARALEQHKPLPFGRCECGWWTGGVSRRDRDHISAVIALVLTKIALEERDARGDAGCE